MLKNLLALVFLIDSIVLLDNSRLLFDFSIVDHSPVDRLAARVKLAFPVYHKNQIDCAEFRANVTLLRVIGEGAVKRVWLGKWSSNGYVAVSFLKSPAYSDDFQHNIHMLRNFTLLFNSKLTAQYLGDCDGRILFTKFYRLGPLSDLYHLLPRLVDRLASRECFQFCIRYARVIDYLHNSPIGRRVMCDSNDLAKLASQFLIDDDLSIVANDLDALPNAEVPIKCGNRSLIGDLIAPEQQPRNATYDHRIDLYKLPFVCDYIRSLCARNELLELLLSRLHTQCLDRLPSNRPNASQILSEYLKINHTLFSN